MLLPSSISDRRYSFLTFSLIAFSSVIFNSSARSDEPQPERTQLEVDIDRSLERYKVYLGDESQPMTALPVLTWDNPLAGTVGKFRTVIFVKDGQAKAVCCIWQGGNQLYHEFGSLTRASLRAELDGQKSWSFDAGLVEFQKIPDADPPADEPRRRLLQMKNLIQRFGAIETMNRKMEPAREQLRLLPTPLYRYEKASAEIVDGAVFAYVHTTDPEALVVMEAVTDGDTKRWQYAFVRRTTMPVIGQLDEKTVWSTDTEGFKTFNQLPYPTN